MDAKSYREKVEVTGVVAQIDTESRTFNVLTDDGLWVTAPYDDETRHRVIEVLRDPDDRLIKVTGLGEFTPGGTLKRVVKAEKIIIAVARWERGEVDPDAPTFSERADALIASFPEEFWENIPTNLVERHLAHHHGQCCRDE